MKEILLLLTIVFTIACHQRNAAKSDMKSPASVSNSNEIKDVIIDANANMADKGTMYNLDSMSTNGDVLSVFVNYSGGCKQHSWDLVSNGMYAKSLPPQISVCLKHTNDGDACRELIMKEIKFNISKLKYGSQKTVVVKLDGKQIRYSVK